jgi:glycerol-3-phosphate dehydrogenase
MSKLKTDVLIIGGGILGTALARELSKYKVKTILVEKEIDFGWGSTKASANVVCQGADCLEFRKEYYRSKLVWGSMPLMEPLCEELDVPFERVGALGIIKDNTERDRFRKMRSRAEAVNITSHKFINRETLRQIEPNITRKAIGALYDPLIAITDPVRLTIALIENAKQNGAHAMADTEVLDISKGVDAFEVQTSQGSIKTKFIVNAAGVFIDKIAAIVNADDFVVFPVKGYIGVLDRKIGDMVNHVLYAIPKVSGEYNMVFPSVHGNIFFGIPFKLCKRGDYSTTREMAERAFVNAKSFVPAISKSDLINSFAGFMMFRNWELGWHECVVRPSRTVPRFINVSIGYPGISAAPATAKEVVKFLAQEGLKLIKNTNFNPFRKGIINFNNLSDMEKKKLIAQDPKYGHVVCRCETVTEGEVHEAIRRGATSLDGVKFRTRAGMGRCQGGFCSPRIIKILAKELHIPEKEVTKKGHRSQQLLFESKELLEEKK